MPGQTTTPKPEERYYTINEIARKQGFTPQYVRTLIRRGQLESDLVPIAEGAQVVRHMISAASLEKFLNTTNRKTKRTDGRNKYVFYANQSEYGEVLAALMVAGLDEIIESLRTANKLKPPYKEAKNVDLSDMP